MESTVPSGAFGAGLGFATALSGRLGLEWSDRFGAILGFAQGSFARSQEEDAEEPIELTDDLVAEVAFRPGPSGAVARIVGGATPLWLSAAFIIEEGTEITLLRRVVETMKREADKAGVVVEVLAENEKPVEFDQPLFAIV